MQINKTISLILVFQILLLLMLAINIYYKKNQKVSVSPVNKNDILKIDGTKLKYYYDLKPNSIATRSISFLKSPTEHRYNDDGLHDSQNYSTEKQNNVYRIITLGDSFTYGLFVETKDNWTEVLEKKLNEKQICKNIDKFEIINLGVEGYDIEYESERYGQKGQKYNPDLVIWMLTDIDRVNEIRQPFFDECYKKNPNQIDYECWDYSMSQIQKEYSKYYIYERQKQGLIDFRNKNVNLPILFIDYFGTHDNIINKIANSSTLNNLLTKEYLLQNNKEEDFIFPDHHPNKFGYQLIADIIYNKLLELNQFPCQPIKQSNY